MLASITENGVEIIKPKIKYNEDGKLKLDGICWVDGDSLDCYQWEEEDMLWMLDTIPASNEDIPEDRYYCFNVNKDDYGWILKSQAKFSMELTE